MRDTIRIGNQKDEGPTTPNPFRRERDGERRAGACPCCGKSDRPARVLHVNVESSGDTVIADLHPTELRAYLERRVKQAAKAVMAGA